MLAPAIDAQTGDLLVINGLVQFYPSYVYKVNRQVMQRLGQDVYNGIANGNPLLDLPKKPIQSQVSQGVNYALTPLTSNGEIVFVSVNDYIIDTKTNRGSVNLTITPPNNPPQELTIPL